MISLADVSLPVLPASPRDLCVERDLIPGFLEMFVSQEMIGKSDMDVPCPVVVLANGAFVLA